MYKKIVLIIVGLVIVGVTLLPFWTEAKSSGKASEDFANVIFFAYFKGDTEGKDFLINNFDNYKNIYSGEGELTVRGYLNKVSYGQFNLVNVFPQYKGNTLVPVELSCSADGLENENMDYIIIQNIINSVPEISDNLDYNNDGFIDNFSIILKGGSASAASNSTLVNHKSDYAGDDTWSGKRLGSYNMLNTYGITNNGTGMITHEFMHSLGYPDLYTYDDSYPVYTWDIMGSVNKYMSYPLAYLRSKFSNWLSIETITTSQTLTLDTQYNENGNQAYILKSPLNEYELFVIEFRKKANDLEHIDRLIGNSGIIVYRINTTVEGLSNSRGQIGVYVFRESSEGTDDSSKRVSAYNAMYSKELGKTSIGVSDLSITEGALTFSDGTNSGIVISNISSSQGEQMTCDVSIPAESEYDTWKNIGFIDEVGGDSYTRKSANIIEYNNKIYSATIGNNKIYTQTYNGENWTTINTTEFGESNNVTKVDLVDLKNQLYLIATEWEKIKIYRFTNNKWESITSIEDTNGLDGYKVYNDELYLSTVDYSGKNVTLYKLNNNKFTNLGTYYKGGEYAGSPKIESINDEIYAINNQANGLIKIYKKENNAFTEINTEMNANQYDVVSKSNKLYFVLGSDANNPKMRIVIYDGKKFETINTEIKLGAPHIIASQGNIYVLATDTSASGKTVVYSYDENSKTLTQEGVNVDNSADFDSLNLISKDNRIYVILKRGTDGKFVVKAKSIVSKTKTLKEYLTNAGYKVLGEYVSGFEVGEKISEIKRKLENSNIIVKNKQDIIGTGTEFSYNDEKYISVVYGDIDGDGKINSLDLLKMRQHLIKRIELTGPNKKSASIANGTKINSLDLLKLRRHLLKLELIKQ